MIRRKSLEETRRVTLLLLVGLTCFSAILPSASAQTISTYAGGGSYVNAPPLSVAMQAPASLAVGPAGGIYVAVREHSPYSNDAAFDTNESNEVFRIDPATGQVTRVVGNGINGASGIGGPPTNVSLNDPQGLAFDNAGNLYIADAGNNRVLKVSADPGFDPADPSGLAGGPITARSVVSVFSTSLYHPVSLAFDPTFSNLYVAASTGSSIAFSGVARFNISDGSMTVVAGCVLAYTPGCTLQSVNGLPATEVAIVPDSGNSLAFDAAGNLYIASSSQYGVSGLFRLNVVDGTLTTVSGTGPSGGTCSETATVGTASLGTFWMAFDGSGNLLLADRVDDLVCAISPDPATGVIDSNSPISPIAGRGTFSQGSAPYGQPGYGDGGPAGAATFFFPDGIAVAPTGNVFVSDASEGRVREISVDPATGIVDADSVISTAAGSGGQSNENAGAVGGDGNLATAATMNEPTAVALDGAGNLFVGSDGVIRRVDAKTHIISTVAGHLSPVASSCPPTFENGEPATCVSFRSVGGAPAGLAVDEAGNIYVSGLYTVRRIDTSGDITTIAGGGSGMPGSGCGDHGPAVDACLFDVHGLAFDQQGDLYIADTGDNEIREVTSDGTIRTVAGTGQANPTSAGTTTCVYGGECAGDGGPAVDAPLQQPMYLVWQPTPNLVVQLAQQGSTPIAVGGGTLYFTDYGNGVVRIVDLYNDVISTLDYPEPALGPGYYSVLDLCDGQKICGQPTGIAMDSAGNLFLSSNNGNDAIWKVTAPERTAVPDEPWVNWVTPVTGSSTLTIPVDETVNQENPFGTFVGDGGYVGDATVSSPQALAIDAKGNLYVADQQFHRVRVIKGVARARGDVNGDGQVDKVDLGLIMEALNTPANGPNDPRDLNHDGVINLLDARILVTLCTYPGCAVSP
jgi:sugar lactone lactonase YvrE